MTNIPYVHHTFNPWWGCTKVSPGCDNCFAEAWAKRCGFAIWGPDAPRRIFAAEHFREPLKWNREAEAAGERRRVLCGSMGDLFEIRPSAELDVARERLWELIDRTPALDWLLLTKRPENMKQLAPKAWADGWPGNVWAMTSVERTDYAERIEYLSEVPVRIRAVSAEPLLAGLDLSVELSPICDLIDPDCEDGICGHKMPPLFQWLIIGCEKLPGGKPGRSCPLHDVRRMLVDARAAGVPVFVKQLEIDGRVESDPAKFPEDLRVREFPNMKTLRFGAFA